MPVQSDGFNSALSPVVYGNIALSINTHYIKKNKINLPCHYSDISLKCMEE